MSRSAEHRAEALKEASAIAAALVAELHDVADPEAHLAQRLYPIVRERQKRGYAAKEAFGRLKSNERRIRFLLGAAAAVHTQLLNVVRERDELRACPCRPAERASGGPPVSAPTVGNEFSAGGPSDEFEIGGSE